MKMSNQTNDQLKDRAWDIAVGWYDVTAPSEIIEKSAEKIYQYMLENEGQTPGRVIPMTQDQLNQAESDFINSFTQ
jgi:hypothetical protein